METKKIKIGALIGVLFSAAVCIVSVFLPLISYGGKDHSSYITDSGGGVGKMVIAGAVVAAVLALAAILTKKSWLSKITGIISILSAIIFAGTNAALMFGFNKVNYTPSTGIYALFAGAAFLFITGIMSLSSKKTN